MPTKWKEANNMTALTSKYVYRIALVFLITIAEINCITGCQIYPTDEYLKLVKVPNNLERGSEIFSLEVHPRDNLKLISVDREIDSQYFSYREINKTHISVILAQSLEDLAEGNNSSHNLLKFRIICDSSVGNESSLMTSRLSVTIYVEDANNHAPKFIGSPYFAMVDELTQIESKILCQIYAIDKDKPNTPNSDVYYTILDGNIEKTFSLEYDDNGTCLILNKPLDYDNGERQFILNIGAMDRGTQPKRTNSTVTIKVRDNDDLNPKFTHNIYKAQIKEFYQFPKELFIHQEINFTTPIHAFDQDRGINAPLRYDIIAGNERGIFYLDPQNASLFMKQPIDVDSEKNLVENTFIMTIRASQMDNPLQFSTTKVEVEILDINDNLPEFEVDFYNISIVENLPNGFSVLQVVAHDKDQGQNSEFKYELEDQSGAFSIDSNSGWLIVRDESILDREKRTFIKMKVFAVEKMPNVILSAITPFSNGSSSSLSSSSSSPSIGVEVTILDANDNNPIFVPSNLYELVAQVDSKVGTVLGQVHAVDKDQGRNGMVLYRLQRPGNSTYDTPFAVDAQTGVISVTESPIMEGRHAIFIEAMDNPLNPSERRLSLAVVAIDVFWSDGHNTAILDFVGAPYKFWIGVDVPIGTTVGRILVNNAVSRTFGLIYDLLHSYQEGVPFAVEEISGTITVVDEIGKYKRLFYDFEAVATNEKDITLITNVSIYVVDASGSSSNSNDGNDDDKATDIYSLGTTKAPLIFHVNENCASSFIGRIFPASAQSEPNNIRFFIANQQDIPEIDITVDGLLYTNHGLDREAKQNYSITVIGETLRGVVAIFQVTVIIDDENDNPPVFSSSFYEGYILENSPVGTEVIMKNPISAHDVDNGINGSFAFTLRDEGSSLFKIDQNTGNIFYIGTAEHDLDREKKSIYNMKIVATDKGAGNLKTETELRIRVEDVNDNPPNLTQIIILPDHNIRVSKELTDTSSLMMTTDGSDNLSIINKNSIQDDNNNNNNNNNHHHHNYYTSDEIYKRRSPIFYIPENVTLGAIFLRLVAHDKDKDKNAEITYNIISEFFPNETAIKSQPLYRKRHFSIDSRSGEISVIRNLPAETDIRIDVRATDGGNLTDTMTLRMHIMDVNDHTPLFRQSLYLFDIEEGIYEKYKIGSITAFDSDFGSNANISYELITGSSDQHDAVVQFNIGKFTGDLVVSGSLDREQTRNVYNFRIKARDQGVVSLSSFTDVEIKILDINDNPPTFYGYDKISKLYNSPIDSSRHQQDHHQGGSSSSGGDRKPTEQLVPIYHASVSEDVPIGSTVVKIFANDSDSIVNGNGLVIYDLVNLRVGETQYFTIDSKEGLVTTIASLKYETLKFHNLTIIASDLGTPSLSSTALLIVTIATKLSSNNSSNSSFSDNKKNDDINSEQKPLFQNRYYEIEVEENTNVPLQIVQISVDNRHYQLKRDLLHYSIDHDKSSTANSNYFSIDSKNGTIYLMKPVDREQQDLYEIIVRVDKMKDSRGMSLPQPPVMIYPITEEKLNGLAFNEAKVIVKIKDVNDNPPKFKHKSIDGHNKPLLAVIPNGAHSGYEIIKIEAEDADEGINGEIRYQILTSENEEGDEEDAHSRFAIDSVSGQVKSVANFARDTGRIFGIDIKATDRQGAEDGLSSIINLIIYVLDDHKQVIMIMGKRPSDLEEQMEHITMILRNMTGLDVRIQKLEPHIENNLIDNASSDMYLYAIDPNLKIVDTEILHNVFRNKKVEIKRELDKYNVLDITRNVPRRINQRYLLSTLEVGIVVLGCVVFIGTLVTALCVTCVRRNKRQQFSNSRPAAFALTTEAADATGTLQKTFSFPSLLTNHHHHHHHPQSLHYDTEPFSSEMQRSHNFYDHESNVGIRFHSLHSCRTAAGAGKRFETSATSLYSSGQDSGIVARICHCNNSYSPASSGESSNGYEDSLKSFQQHMSRDSAAAATCSRRKQSKFHSLSVNLESSSSAAYPDAQESSTSGREKRNQTTAIRDQRQRHVISKGREHSRSNFSEAENNITETVIHEHHPGMELLMPGSLSNTIRLHPDTTRTRHLLY